MSSDLKRLQARVNAAFQVWEETQNKQVDYLLAGEIELHDEMQPLVEGLEERATKLLDQLLEAKCKT